MHNDYEAKRKQQNREAQRRYRNRCKEGSSSRRAQAAEKAPQPAGSTPSAASWTAASPILSPPSHAALAYASPSMTDVEFPGHGGRGGRAMAATPFLDANSVSGFDDYLSNDFSYFGADLNESTFSPHSTTSYHTPGALPSTSSGSGSDSWMTTTTTPTTTSTGHGPHMGIASNLCAKAEGLIDELERLYEFGVDMEIISPRGALADNLSETRGLFREVAHVGGKRRR